MTERLSSNPERDSRSPELESVRDTQHEKIKEDLERSAERAHETNAEAAKNEALEKAHSVEKYDDKAPTSEKSAERRPRKGGKKTKKLLDESFNKQMSDARHDMSAPSRTFSTLIHAKPVEAVSEAVGSTIARPNAILAGSVTAFILVSGLYLLARHIGYPLSGFETIGAFIIGWIVGIMIDFFRVMITGKR